MRPWVLAESHWPAVADAAYDVAVLPWGATEAHNRHLPYATDSISAEHVAIQAAAMAWQSGARVVVLPTIPFGVQTGQLDIPLCINVNPSTQLALLRDIVQSVERAGIAKLVILNGHGGNDFKAMVRELQPATAVFLCTMQWYAASDPREFFTTPGDHAGELETAVMMHAAPSLVAPIETAGAGNARQFRVRALREGWAWAPRQWTRVTDDTGVGDPSRATVANGERFVTACVANIAAFFAELAAADPAAMYQ